MDRDVIFKSLADSIETYGEIVCDDQVVTAGNSFFDRSYFGTRILVLAPNPGDEISVAGNMILNFAAAKAEVFVAYMTRFSDETVTALKVLGVSREKIVLLDRNNLKRELKKLIVELRANIIFCADFDLSDDCKIMSLTFETVMGEILSARSDYRPEVYKKFAGATASTSAADFYAPNLLSVRHPYECKVIDRANYVWNNRVRFPVNECCRRTLLKNNPLADAIFAYKSKHIEWDALRILNSDEIFFERRTDNQALTARVSATSGDASKVHDFKIIDSTNLNDIDGHVWRPTSDDIERRLTFEWVDAVQVRRIVIYGNANDTATAKLNLKFTLDNFRAAIDKTGIYLDNICKVDAKLPECGNPLILDVDKMFVCRAEIEVVECGRDFGIAEVEFFANIDPLRKIEPFIKLTAGKDFFYRHDIPYEVEKIPLGVYRFHVDEPVRVCAESNGDTVLNEVVAEDEELILNLGDADEIILTAEVIGNPNIYDRAVIRRAGDLAQIQLKVWQWLDKMRVHKIRNI